MLDWLQNVGKKSLHGFESLGRSAMFFIAVVQGIGVAFIRFRLTLREIYSVGVLSLVIIAVSGLFVGMVQLIAHWIL